MSVEARIDTQTDESGETWFKAGDVCEALSYESVKTNLSNILKKHVDQKDNTSRIVLTAGGKQKVKFINESGLYSLILGSQLEAAKKFKHWVTSEILPSVRKTGSYSTDQSNSAGWVERSKNDASAVLAKIAARIYAAKLEKDSGSKPSTTDFQMLNIEVNKGAFNYHEKGMRSRMTSHGEKRLESAYSTVVFELATENIKTNTYSKSIVRDHGKDSGVSILPESKVKQIKSERKHATKTQRKLSSKDRQSTFPEDKLDSTGKDEDTNW